uniref:Uncharacterized protein n=1 Tax=Daphnia galeata TaxID=27404 RepID=A0A8J2RT03_9CRUS|nr:unnamed protein product [Daphnia galeata]
MKLEANNCNSNGQTLQKRKWVNSSRKKSYADLLIDRPFNTNQSLQGDKESITSLLNSLLHRLHLPAANSKKLEPALNQQNVKSKNAGSLMASMLANKYQTSSSSAATKKTSLYDTLLQLIDEYDATGVAEIVRLLLERRTAIPIFHRQDLSAGGLSSKPLIAEIGVGCLVIDGTPQTNESSATTKKSIQHVLVIHVVGNFRPLWQCLKSFANYLLVEDSTIENQRFCLTFPPDSSTTAQGLLDSFDFSCVWTPSTGEMSWYEFDEKINEFQLRIKGLLQGPTLNLLKDSVIMASNQVITNSKTSSPKVKMLHGIPILIKEDYSPLKCVAPSEMKWDVALESIQNLGDVKKSKFLLQKDYLEQAKIEEEKVEHGHKLEKVAQLEDKIRKLKATFRSNTEKVQKHPLINLFLDILNNKDSSSRVLSFNEYQKLRNSYSECLRTAVGKTEAVSKLEKQLHSAKTELIENALNVEHLWRELSHLYTESEHK